jgi:hypothetical protein
MDAMRKMPYVLVSLTSKSEIPKFKRAMLGQNSLRLEPNCSHGDNRIMLADLSIMGPANPSCFGKKPMTTLQHDV